MVSASDFHAAAANNCSLSPRRTWQGFLVVCEIRPRGRARLSLTSLLRPAPSREFQRPTNHPAAWRLGLLHFLVGNCSSERPSGSVELTGRKDSSVRTP